MYVVEHYFIVFVDVFNGFKLALIMLNNSNKVKSNMMFQAKYTDKN